MANRPNLSVVGKSQPAKASTVKGPKAKPVSEANAQAVATRLFQLDRETKGAVRYHELDDAGNTVTMQDGLIGQIYIRKDKLAASGATEIPQTVTVTITF